MNDLVLAELRPDLPQDFAGIDGFIPGSRASIMLDVVFVAMFAVVPIMAWAIWLVRARRNYLLHKRVQVALGVILLIAVTAFEVDMRVSGWRHRAEPSPFYALGDDGGPNWVMRALYVHLCFAVPTAVLWLFVIVQALRKIPNPPRPSPYSRTHIFWARIAAWEMVGTAVTGWLFYYLAFLANP